MELIVESNLNEYPELQMMVLAHNKSLLKYLYEGAMKRNIADGDIGYYLGGMKAEKLKESESKKLILGTYAMASEGLDIKTLTSLILATPKSDIVQSVGRILRKKHKQALVIDIVDQHPVFQKHWKKRKTFYKKQKFKVIKATMEGYRNNNWDTVIDLKKNIFKKSTKNSKVKKLYVNTDDLLQGVCLLNNDDLNEE